MTTHRIWRTVLMLFGGAWLAVHAMASVAEESTPQQVIEATSVELLALIEEARGYVDEDPDRFFGEVEALLAPVVDFNVFSRGVMSTHYKQASAEQRDRFADTFKTALVRTYATALTEFRDGEVVVLPPGKPSSRPGYEQVKMEIRLSAAEVYPVSYAMGKSKSDGQWRVLNIVINGINIGRTYREQFKSAYKQYNRDLDQVIDAWGNVIASGEDDGDDTAT